jgi:UDP-N-acetyl-D-galactosamine dehydrogenase
MANPAEVQHEYALVTTAELPDQKFDAVVLGVAHREFLKIDFSKLQNTNSLLYDVKGILGDMADGKL